MASEKKPSIYDDRGTIGSVSDLDEYGVWVKNEPQDLTAVSSAADVSGEEADEKIDAGDLDFEIPNIDDLPAFGSLEDETAGDISGDTGFRLPEDGTDNDSGSGEDNDDTAFDFGDFLRDADLTELPKEETDGAESAASIEAENPLLSDEEISTGSPDFSALEEIAEPVSEELNEIADDKLALPSGETGDTSGGNENDGFTEVSMDDFIETLDAVPEETEQPSEAVDLSTQLLMKIAEELSSIRNELKHLKIEVTGIKAAAPQVADGEADLYPVEDDEKISLTGDELNNILNTADFTEEVRADASADLSDSPEQTSPKTAGEEPDALMNLDLDISLDEAGLDEAAGTEPDVFDISFGEETPPQEEEAQLLEELEELPEISEELEPIELEELPAEESEAEDAALMAADESLPDFITLDEPEELKQIRENGVEPMAFAPAPEDTEYLIKDPPADRFADEDLNPEELTAELTEALSEDSSPEMPIDLTEEISIDLPADISGESLDLSDAVIDEPDLSSEIRENPLEEPSLEDITINLDLSELDSSEAGAEELEELLPDESDSLDIIEIEEEPEIPLDISDLEAAKSVLIEDGDLDPGDDDDDPVLIPEGFVEEAAASGDIPIPADEPEEELISEEELLSEDEPDAGVSLEGIEEGPEAVIDDLVSEENAGTVPKHLKSELKTVLLYMDQLLESLPDNKIEEFAQSEHFDTYKKLFRELGLV